MHFTLWPSKTANEGGHTEITWQAFLEFVAAPQVAEDKNALEGWSPVRFTGNRRGVEHVELVSGIVLDIDLTELRLNEVAAIFAGFAGVVHTTHSHTAEHPKYRPILQANRDMTRDEHARVWQWVSDQAKSRGLTLDQATKDASRLWYVPSRREGAPYEYAVLEGVPLDVDTILAMVPATEPPNAPATPRADAPAGNRRAAMALALGSAWPVKGRHEAQLALAGALRAEGFTAEDATDFLCAVCRTAGDEDRSKREQTVRHTWSKPDGAALTGWTRLKQHVDAVVVDAARGALGRGAEFTERTERMLAERQIGTPDVQAATRPTIDIKCDLGVMVDQGIAALATTDIYQRSRKLVSIVRSDGAPGDVIRCVGSPIIRQISNPSLKERLSQAARWIRKTNDGTRECLPPPDVVDALAARGEWQGIRPLIGIAEAPVLRPGGTVFQTPGYDLETGYLLVPNTTFPPVPDAPTLADAKHARDELLEVVVDFPFADEAHRAAWLAAALTPFARPAIDGCVPLVAIDASTRGTGKSLLSDTVAILAAGREASRMPQPQNDEEMRKRITSLIRECETLVVLDNIAQPIEYASLDSALTTTQWKDRILSKTETFAGPNRLFWLASGNNLEFRGDVIRRVLHIRIETRLENPENRQGFKHSPLLPWIKRERPRLVRAALTILRAFFVAGCQSPGNVTEWGSFEEWSRIVAGAVTWVGLPDPRGTRVVLDASGDRDKSTLGVVLDAIDTLAPDYRAGITAKELLTASLHDARLTAFREVIEDLPAKRQVGPKELGEFLRRFRQRIVGNRMLEPIPDRKGVNRWRVVTI